MATYEGRTGRSARVDELPGSATELTEGLVTTDAQEFGGQKTLSIPLLKSSENLIAGDALQLLNADETVAGKVKVYADNGVTSFQISGIYPGSWYCTLAMQGSAPGDNRNNYKATFQVFHMYQETSIQGVLALQGSQWQGGAVSITVPGSNDYIQVSWNGHPCAIRAVCIGATV